MKSVFAIVVLTLIVIAGCGSGETPGTVTQPADLLTESLGSTGINRTGEVRTFTGQDLWEYINGGAELFHTYDFVEVATGDYKKGEVEMVADIYRFTNARNAYGLYSMLRPDDPDFVQLGAEGYVTPATIMFVAGPYLVKVMSYEDTDESSLSLVNLSDALAGRITKVEGASEKPAAFSLFPASGRLPGTDKYWSKDFAGHDFLSRVYSMDYLVDSTRLTLFLSVDEPGAKVLQWSAAAEEAERLNQLPDGLEFDDGKGFATEDGYYGTILVGMKGGRLAGVIGYTEEGLPLVSGWLKSLGEAGIN